MKRNFVKLFAVTSVLLGGSLAASATERLKVNVPFSFVLAGLNFQPGQYTVGENNNGVVIVQGAGQAAAVITVPAEQKPGAPTSLRFTTDGHEYRLVGVQVEGEVGRAIPAPAVLEHKLSAGSR